MSSPRADDAHSMSIAVIIPSRKAENLGPCLRAIRKQEPCVHNVLVVDDGVDWSKIPADLLPETIPGAKPFCYARNMNIGIWALAAGAEYLVLLNDDALLLTPEGFTRLAKSAKEHPEYGVISAVCRSVGNLNQMPQGIGLRDEARMLCFVCVLIPRHTFERIGLLDERFGGYAEDGRKIYGFCDQDYSRRTRNAGLFLGIDDYCKVDHEFLVSTFRGDPKAPIDLSIGAKIYLDKWGDMG